MYNHTLYLIFWAINSLVLYFVYTVFPDAVVLGNFRFFPTEAAIYSGFWVTVFVWSMWDFLHARGVSMNKNAAAFWIFFGINSLSIWLVTRFPHIAGLGITSFYWAFFVGFLVNIFQRIAWRMVAKRGV